MTCSRAVSRFQRLKHHGRGPGGTTLNAIGSTNNLGFDGHCNQIFDFSSVTYVRMAPTAGHVKPSGSALSKWTASRMPVNRPPIWAAMESDYRTKSDVIALFDA